MTLEGDVWKLSDHVADCHTPAAECEAQTREATNDGIKGEFLKMPADADYLLDEWPEGLLAHTANPTVPVFVVSAMAAHPQASQGARCGQIGS